MPDFSKLDPETRAFAMVGQFMQAFALMEIALHNAIGAALTIDKIKIQVLGANIELSKKVQILRTLIHISDAYSTEDKESLKSNLKKIITYAETRNMAAHCFFEESKDGKGVTFSHVRASGEFSADQNTWSDVRLLAELQKLGDFESLLNEIEQQFRNKPVDASQYWLHQSLWELPYYDMIPMRRTMSPALLDNLTQPAFVPLPPSEEASHKPNSQTPDKPQNSE